MVPILNMDRGEHYVPSRNAFLDLGWVKDLRNRTIWEESCHAGLGWMRIMTRSVHIASEILRRRFAVSNPGSRGPRGPRYRARQAR